MLGVAEVGVNGCGFPTRSTADEPIASAPLLTLGGMGPAEPTYAPTFADRARILLHLATPASRNPRAQAKLPRTCQQVVTAGYHDDSGAP